VEIRLTERLGEMAFPTRASPFRLAVFIIGVIILVWGLTAIAVSAGITPLSLVRIETPLGTVETNDRQFGGGLLLGFFGLLIIMISSRL